MFNIWTRVKSREISPSIFWLSVKTEDTVLPVSAEALTVLCQLGRADQGGDLEVVLADGTVAQALGALPGG